MTELVFSLIAAHFICDYPLQTEAIALGKNRNIDKARFGVNWWYWMSGHSFTHGFAVFLITGNVALGLADTIFHFIVDVGKCDGIFGIHADQMLHIGFRVLIAAYMVI